MTAKADATASSGEDSKSFGIFCDGGGDNITITNAIVSATGGAAETSGGIISKYDLTISGGATVAATGGNVTEIRDSVNPNRVLIPRSIGLGCAEAGSVKIEDSTVIATGGNLNENGKSGKVTWQAGRSCGVYCGNSGSSSGGQINFSNCFVVARAGTVGNEYKPNESVLVEPKTEDRKMIVNKRCAVFNVNSANDAITRDKAIIAGAAGYYSGTGTPELELLTEEQLEVNEGLTKIYDYADSTATRTVIGLSKHKETDEKITYYDNIAATGVVIVPEDWAIKGVQTYGGYVELGGNTAIVTTDPNALTIYHTNQAGTTIDTAGLKLAAVSLYEGTSYTAGIKLYAGSVSGDSGNVTFTGGGEVIAVGGMTNGKTGNENHDSFGIQNENAIAAKATVNAATLTAYGSTKAVADETVLVTTPAFKAYPAEGIAGDNRLMKILVGYPLYVDGRQVTSMNASDVLRDGKVSYDPQTFALTLEGAAVSGIRSESLNLKLILKGENAISKGSDGNGIAVSDGNLNIESGGESTVSTDADGKTGIWVDGTLTVNSSGFLTVAASGNNGTGVQIPSDSDKKITINGGMFTASGLGKAVSKTPIIGYSNYAVTASTDASGTPTVVYNVNTIDTYKYLRVEPTYTISGTVTDGDTHQVLAGARVQLADSNGSVVGSDAVLTDGGYAISNVHAGTGYVLKASMDGYDGCVIRNITVSADIPLDIELSETPISPSITTTALSDGMVGVSYRETLAATCNTSFTWSHESGKLPDGLSLDGSGEISGTPTKAGTYTFTVKATNSAGSGTQTLSITVIAAPITPAGGGTGGIGYTGDEFSGTWEVLPGGGLRLIIKDGDCAKFTSVIVDGEQLVAGTDYELLCGSTIIIFKPSYLATLRDGTHTVRAQFTNGRYNGSFTTPLSTAVAAVTEVPATGGAPLVRAVLLAALGLAVMAKRKVRRS